MTKELGSSRRGNDLRKPFFIVLCVLLSHAATASSRADMNLTVIIPTGVVPFRHSSLVIRHFT
jgi:hypothetical protein